MERLKNLKMLLTILFIAAAGSLFLYDGKRTSDVQWQTAEETASETECLDMTPEENTDKAETESACAEPEMIYVYICGHLRQPDVYSLAAGTRLYEAIEAAGGAADDADLQQLNLADQLTDGQRIYVPAEGETAADPEYTEDEVSNGLVNINTATAEQLQTLPGIGQAKANAIVAYREANGNFSSTEDLRNVPGIKEGVFGQIQSLICVN